MSLLEEFIKNAIHLVYAKESLVDLYELEVIKELPKGKDTARAKLEFDTTAYDTVIKDYRVNLKWTNDQLDYALRAVLYYLDMAYLDGSQPGDTYLQYDITFLKHRSDEFRLGEAMIRAKYGM